MTLDHDQRYARHMAWPKPWRIIIARLKLFGSFAIGALVMTVLLGLRLPASTAGLIGWNIACCLYLGLVWSMMMKANPAAIRYRARIQDEGTGLIALFTFLTVAACLVAIVLELLVKGEGTPWPRAAHRTLAIFTIISAWAFVHTIFALHYAHAYYDDPTEQSDPGLQFPGSAEPVYSDFLYTAFIIGTSSQTADVAFTTTETRRLALVHSTLAFAFNTFLLALCINISAGLMS